MLLKKHMERNNYLVVENENVNINFLDKYSGSAGFLIKSGLNSTLNLTNISCLNELFFEVEKDAYLTINIILDDSNTNLVINSNLAENAQININQVDFSFENKLIKYIFNLNGENSSCNMSASCLNTQKFIKKYTLLISHNARSTFSDYSICGVATDDSNIIVDGFTHINKDCSKSIAKQSAKVILFNEKCKAKASPQLIIDNEDISASHGFVVGTLNADHMFYLLSRGISEKDAKNLITFGYLKPVLEAFSDNEKENLTNLLRERI